MDALAALLDGPRARGSFLLRAVLDPPFGISVEDEAPLTVVTLVRGELWVLPRDGDPVRLGPGDVAVLRGPTPYRVVDHPASPVRTVILPGNRSATLDGDELCDELDLGPRTWGDRTDGAIMMLVGTYPTPGEVSRQLLSALPDLLVLPAATWDPRLLAMLQEEIARDAPGQDVVLDRLLDLLVITGLRSWCSRADGAALAWFRGNADPIVGQALRLVQQDPAFPWSVDSLAQQAGVSRATLARRFTEVMGEPPIAYLTRWRLALAADLLRESDATIGAVARQVGYGSGFALSAAFKRMRGVSPQQHRRRVVA